jgi:hypothetical protein
MALPQSQAAALCGAIEAFFLVQFVAASGGLYPIMGLFSVDIKTVMGYSQEYVNVISAATYIGAAIAQIALGFEQTRNPIRTMLLCQLCVPLGFFGTFATVRFDLPWATMVVSDALLAFGVAGMCLPSTCLFATTCSDPC